MSQVGSNPQSGFVLQAGTGADTGATPQGATPQGATPQGATPQGAASQGAASQGAASQGAASQGAASQGAASQGATPQNDGDWATRIIRTRINRDMVVTIQSKFEDVIPDIGAATVLFQDINKQIDHENTVHGVPASQGCIIPENQYEVLYEQFFLGVLDTIAEEDRDRLFEETREKFAAFNREHHLPEEWNITDDVLANIEEAIAMGHESPVKREDVVTNINQLPHHGATQNPPQHPPIINIDALAGEFENLDILEETARNTMCGHSNGKVLFWWKRGSGSQIFVRYGTGENAMFRIRAGSYEPYDPKKVPRIFSIQRGGRGQGWDELKREEGEGSIAQPRGHLKVIAEDEEGEFQENWMYGRSDVAGILGVGWKVDDDDDFEGEPLDRLWPEGGDEADYPFTRILVAWKDRTLTLEDRSFIRRIKRGPTKLADILIYQKAVFNEVLYRKEQGLSYEHLLEDLRSLKSDSRQKTPGVMHGVMPISESPDPSLPVPTQGTTPAPGLLGVGTPTPSRWGTPAPARGTTPAPARGATPAPVGENPQDSGSTITPAERFASMLRGSAPPGPQNARASMPTAAVEDPKDAQIRELQAQVAQLTLAMNPNSAQPRYNLRSHAQMPVPSWGTGFPSPVPGYSPEPARGRMTRRKGRGRTPNVGNWAGQYAIPNQPCYA
ncbi:hypothetical protein BJX76DRAFT_357706 [Aspergillus varians]